MKKIYIITLTVIMCFVFASLPSLANTYWLEAETEGVLSDGAKIINVNGASAGGAVTLGEVTYEIDVEIAERYFVRMGYRSGEGNIVLIVDGAEYDLGVGDAVYGTKWARIYLSEGKHTITYRSEGGEAVIDYVSIYSNNIPMGSDTPSGEVDNPYEIPETSDIGFMYVILGSVSLFTSVGMIFSVKKK